MESLKGATQELAGVRGKPVLLIQVPAAQERVCSLGDR